MTRHELALVATLAVAVTAKRARAELPHTTTDGVYGRFDGDLDLSVEAGGAIGRGGSAGAALVRTLYLGTAGIYASYDDAFGTSSAPPRAISVGVGARPLFLPRWGYNMDRGPALLDLTIDATTLDLGVVWAADPQGHFSRPPGFELALGTEVPLLARAEGPWIGVRGVFRWEAEELAAPREPQSPPRPVLFLTFAWHFVINTHTVDSGDGILR